MLRDLMVGVQSRSVDRRLVPVSPTCDSMSLGLAGESNLALARSALPLTASESGVSLGRAM